MAGVDELHAFFEKLLLAKGNEKDRGELNRTVREITEGMTTELEKMDTIFKWVQSNIKYIAFEDGVNGFVPRSCSKVMKNKYGDCKDMGNLLVEMLTYAKVENAHVAWVGTRSIPYLMSEFPSPITCNHVICVVDKPDGDYYYLDATGSELSYLIPPQNIQNKEILVHYGPGKYKLHKVKPIKGAKNALISDVYIKFTDEDSIYGNGINTYKGCKRTDKSYRLKNYDKEDLKEYIKNICLDGLSKYTLKKYSLENLEENNADLKINYDFSFKNYLVRDGDEYFFNPGLFELTGAYYSKEDYKQSRSKTYYRDNTYTYKIELSDNFQVAYLPKDIEYSHDLFNFKATYTQEGNIVTLVKYYEYSLLEVTPSLFEYWNEFAKAVNYSTMQNIILVKKKITYDTIN